MHCWFESSLLYFNILKLKDKKIKFYYTKKVFTLIITNIFLNFAVPFVLTLIQLMVALQSQIIRFILKKSPTQDIEKKDLK